MFSLALFSILSDRLFDNTTLGLGVQEKARPVRTDRNYASPASENLDVGGTYPRRRDPEEGQVPRSVEAAAAPKLAIERRSIEVRQTARGTAIEAGGASTEEAVTTSH